MRQLMFYFFRRFVKIENIFFEKFVSFLSLLKTRKIPGVRTFSRAIRKSRKHLSDLVYYKFKPKGIVFIEVYGNKMYVDTDDKDIAPKLILEDYREESYETALFCKMIKEGMVVVDVGANIGLYTLIASRLVGKTGVVYAFEAMPINYELLCKNIEINNYTNVVPIQKAVSNKTGEASFWFEKDWRGSSSLSKLSVLAVSKHKIMEKGGFVKVKTISLDNFFENTIKNNRVSVIKIDTGGAEGLIIDGSPKIFKDNVHLKIFLEFWPDALQDLGTNPLELLQKLQEYGFAIKFINEAKQTLEFIDIKEEKYFIGTGFNLLLEK